MGIKGRFTQFKSVAVKVIGFIKRHKRASMATGVALLIAGPLLTGTSGETFFLNLVGLGVGALLVRRFTRPRGQRRTAAQQKAKQQQQGGTP